MKETLKYVIIGLSVIISVVILATAITYFGHKSETISVTGLGETVFTSDMIVWSGQVSVDAYDKQAGYSTIEKQQKQVAEYLRANGIEDSEVTFSFVNAEKQFTGRYENGNYVGSTFTGYQLTQKFTVTSSNVEKVETISREISALIAQGIDIDSWTPEYYYTHLDDLKLAVIEKASKDARARAESIVDNAGARLGKATNANLGVFQITAATGDEEYSYGGTFNTYSKEKKARITVRMTYKLK